MKIYIVGPSGGGKTTFAKKIALQTKIPILSLDEVLYSHGIAAHPLEVSETQWRATLKDVLKQKEWIIEGVNVFPEVLEAADEIIYLRPSVFRAIYRQWKRFFTDAKQRRDHGFVNNIKLSRHILKQYLEEPDRLKIDDPKYTRVRKTDKLLKRYSQKVKRM